MSADPTSAAYAALPVRLRVLRLHVGLTPEEMAERLGVSPRTYRRWETRQTRRNGARLLMQLHALTGVSADWMVSGKPVVGAAPDLRDDFRPLASNGRPLPCLATSAAGRQP